MIFVFVMNIARWWYTYMLFPLLFNPVFYKIVAMLIISMSVMTFSFLYHIDKNRLVQFQKKVGIAIIKSYLLGFLASTILVSLIGSTLTYMVQSDFFIRQRGSLMNYLLALMPEYSFESLALFFLISSQYFVIESVSEISYHLQDSKKWWIFFGLSTCVSFLCYVIVIGLN